MFLTFPYPFLILSESIYTFSECTSVHLVKRHVPQFHQKEPTPASQVADSLALFFVTHLPPFLINSPKTALCKMNARLTL